MEIDEIKQNIHEKEVGQQARVINAHESDREYDNSQIFESQPELEEQGTQSEPLKNELSEEDLNMCRWLMELFETEEPL